LKAIPKAFHRIVESRATGKYHDCTKLLRKVMDTMIPDESAFLISLAGLAIAALGYLWLVVKAFGKSTLWGILSFLFVPAGLLFALLNLKRVIAPVAVMFVGVLISVAPLAINLIVPAKPQDTAAVEKKEIEVGGQKVFEERITLTGAKREEYAKLEGKNFAVVQWSNADVTDDDVAGLKGMTTLRELDLNNTQITDKTLELLAEIKTLKVLRIANTKATAEGVKKSLLPLSNLTELDVRGLKLTRKELNDWKAINAAERKFAN